MLYQEDVFKCAGIIIYRRVITDKNASFEFLLVETRRKKFKYSFPKGKREHNETVLQTAKRETQEETGLLDTDYKLHPDVYFIEYLKGSSTGLYDKPHIYYYVAEIKDHDHFLKPVNDKEIFSCTWFNLTDIKNMTTDFTYQRRCIIYKVLEFIEAANFNVPIVDAH